MSFKNIDLNILDTQVSVMGLTQDFELAVPVIDEKRLVQKLTNKKENEYPYCLTSFSALSPQVYSKTSVSDSVLCTLSLVQ